MKKIILLLIFISTISVANAQLDIPLPQIVPDVGPGGGAYDVYNRISQSSNDLARQRLEIQRLEEQNKYYAQVENERLLLLKQQRKLIEMQLEAVKQKQSRTVSAKSKNIPTYAGGLTLFTTEVAAQNHCPNDTVVWLNLPTGIWHPRGARWYGNTKNGSYVCKNEALITGNRRSLNGQ